MKLTRLTILGLLVLALLVAGCGSKKPAATPIAKGGAAGTPANGHPAPTSPPLSLTAVAPETPSVTDLSTLIARLRAAGASVGQPSSLAQSPFTVQGNDLRVNGAEVQVFEYPADNAAQAEAAQLSPDGTTLAGKALNWPETPHVFQKGRLLIVYPGSDVNVLNPLEFVLGREITGAAAAATAGPVAAAGTPATGKPVTGTVTAAAPAGAAGCTDKALMIADVTVPDNTNIPAGQSFLKTWRLRNTGTCTWTPNYALVFAGGPSLGGPAAVPISATVAPGNTVDVSIDLSAPTANGTTRSKYSLRNADGKVFGIDNSRDGTFWVQIVVGPGANERINMPAGASSATVQTKLTNGVPRGYVLRVQAGQHILVQTANPVTLTIVDPKGTPLPVTKTADQLAWDATATTSGDHLLVLRGNGSNILNVTVPPATTGAAAPTQQPAKTQRVTFPPGATSVALSFALVPGTTQNYVLTGKAGQILRLYLGKAGSTFKVIGPDGAAIKPTAATEDGRSAEFSLPTAGDYTVALQGAGNTITLEIPAS
jgi:hypothetical protein